jgi:PAS domain S-box-containing protein
LRDTLALAVTIAELPGCRQLAIVGSMDTASSDVPALVTMDHHGRLIDMNSEAETLLGFKRADVLERMLSEILVPPRLRMQHAAGLRRYIGSGHGPVLGKKIEVPALNASGEEVPVELLIRHVENTEPPIFRAELRPANKVAATKEPSA